MILRDQRLTSTSSRRMIGRPVLDPLTRSLDFPIKPLDATLIVAVRFATLIVAIEIDL